MVNKIKEKDVTKVKAKAKAKPTVTESAELLQAEAEKVTVTEPPKQAASGEVTPSSEKRWYIVHSYSGKELAVMRNLKERIKIEKIEDQFGEIVVPTEEVVEMRGGQRCKSKRKFFPGYVLVQMEMNDKTWHLVRHIPWVLGFIGGTSDRPVPVTDAEIDNILQRMQEGAEKPRPKILFEPGEVVRIINGPFADFDGVVEDVNYEKSRLRVSVSIFGRSTPVELEFVQVQKV